MQREYLLCTGLCLLNSEPELASHDIRKLQCTEPSVLSTFPEVEDVLGLRIPTLADGGVPSTVVLSIPGGQHVAERRRKRWVRSVTTDSTHPPPGLFKKKAATIARVLASKKVSPKGPQSGVRMLSYFINRGGRGLSKSRRAELERQRLLSKRVRQNASRFTSVEIDNGIHNSSGKRQSPFREFGIHAPPRFSRDRETTWRDAERDPRCRHRHAKVATLSLRCTQARESLQSGFLAKWCRDCSPYLIAAAVMLLHGSCIQECVLLVPESSFGFRPGVNLSRHKEDSLARIKALSNHLRNKVRDIASADGYGSFGPRCR
jgi:hypothetical protein